MTTNLVLAININFQRIYCDDLEQLTIPLWARIVIKISHLLLGVSSASNIIIYSYQVTITIITIITISIITITITITITRTSTSAQSMRAYAR